MKKVANPISLAGSQLGEVRHVCAFFNNEDEEYRVLLPFIKDGFECGDKAVHVVNPDQRRDHLQRLVAVGIDPTSAEQSGQFELRTNTETYLREGRFDQDRMLAVIAHEVNQPLSGIVTNASTCLRMLAADPPNVEGARETARRTIRDGNRASEVITRLRALFSKKEGTTESVDPNDATREVIALSLSDLQRDRVVLQPELADDLPAVTGDRVQLQQVILNLIRNACDAMRSVEDRPRQLLIRTQPEDGDHVRLTVQDAGVGLEPRSIDRLFEAFYTTKNDGMGMGLSVSRSIIENHHGRLWATPNEGSGATFSFSIPCAARAVNPSGRSRDISTPAVTDTDAA